MYVYWEFVPDSGPTDRESPIPSVNPAPGHVQHS